MNILRIITGMKPLSEFPGKNELLEQRRPKRYLRGPAFVIMKDIQPVRKVPIRRVNGSERR